MGSLVIFALEHRTDRHHASASTTRLNNRLQPLELGSSFLWLPRVTLQSLPD